jgi:Chitobiase/beta-hexosaminidase C-terminal domain
MNSVIKRSALVAAVLLLGAAFSVVSAAPTPQPDANPQACSGGASLSGWYGMLVGSYSGTGGKYLVGAIHFDGACGLTGTNTFGGAGGQFANASVTGTYGANADGTTSITMNLSGQSAAQTYIVGVSQSGNEAVGIETDGTGAYIDLQSQLTTLTSGFTTASLTGTYSASCVGSGVDLNYATFDGQGNITGVDDEENNGAVSTNTPYTGSYTVNSDGTFQGSVLFNGSEIPMYGVLDNGNNEIEYIYSDVNSCSGKKSTTANLSGSYGLLVNGSSSSADGFLTGSINFNGSGAVSGEVNGDFGGQYGNAQVTGSYTLNSNNTTAITLNLAGQSTPLSFGVGVSESGNEAIGVETDITKTANVDLQSQLTGQPYSTSSLSGTYAVVCSNVGLLALNYVTFDGQGNLSGSLAYSNGGPYAGDFAISGTYSVNADGTFAGGLLDGFSQYTFNGVIDNANAEIAYTYDLGGTGNQVCSGVSTYGPVGANPVAATPSFNPAPGAYGAAQSVALSDTTPGAVIHYTTNGTPPTADSPVYSSQVPVSATTSIQAIAVVAGDNNSAIGSGTYFITTLPTAATPTFNPAPGAYSSAQSVTLLDTTPGAVIYYTTNGTAPSQNSTVYGGAIPVSATTTIEAIAVASGYNNSGTAIGSYTITLPTAATPTFNPAPGTYTSAQSVTLSDTTSGAVIHCTTDGTTPSPTSPVCTTLQVSATTTIQAIAVATGYNNSALASGTYTITVGGSGTVLNLSSYFNVYGIATVGTAPKSGGFDNDSYAYNSSLIGTSLTYQTLAFPLGAANALDAVVGQTIPIAAGQYNQLFLLGAGVNGAQTNQTIVVTYTDGSNSTFTQNFSDWAIPQHYTGETTVATNATRVSPNGQTQTLTVNVYGYTFALTSGKTPQSVKLPNNRNVVFLAIGLSSPANLPTAATPTFNPAPGNYSSAQSVTLSDTTTGAKIYYTTNGTTPNLGSSVYSSPLQISATTTIEAIAVATGYNTSATASGVYTITLPTAATPTFNPTPGNYSSAQSVTLSDTTSGAKIYYTTNGTTPNLGSSVYSSPLQISATTTIEAIAVATGYNTSATATGVYTITYAGTPIVPYVQVNGAAWQQTASATVSYGSTVNLGPQPLNGGSWSWTGPNGYTSTSRQINSIPLSTGANNYVATYTNSNGVKSTQTFTITVTGTPIVPYIQVNGGAWQQIANVTVRYGASVSLGPQPLNGGSWYWTGPGGYTNTSRQINGVASQRGTWTFVATYTDPTGAKTTQAFVITVQ